MSARVDDRDRAARAAPAAARPSHDRARFVVPLLLLTLFRTCSTASPRRSTGSAGRSSGSSRSCDVRDHVDHDASRADDRHARAADDAPAREARPAVGLRPGVRPRRGRSGTITAAVAFGLLGLDVEGSIVVVVLLASGTRSSAWRSACSRARSRRRSSRRCSSCRRSCCRSSCSAACSSRATRWPVRWVDSYVLPLTWAYDGLQRAVDGGDAALIARDAAIVFAVTLLALALAAATLRRRTP